MKKQQLDAVNKPLEARSEIRSAYSYREPVHVPLSGEPSRTKQEFKKEVNINTIIERMQKGIQPPAWMTSNTPHYGDFTELPSSFQEAYELVEKAEAAFAGLPVGFRRAIDHDPRNLDKAPRELYEEYGLLKPKNSEEATPPKSPSDGTSPAPKGPGSTPSESSPRATNKPLKGSTNEAD